MQKKISLHKMTAAALLIAIGIIIPTFSPFKFVLEPASYTLASHVPIFISMFISPAVALAVAGGTAVGFWLGGFPIVVVLRAATHVVFACVGAFLFRRAAVRGAGIHTYFVLAILLSILHAAGEVLVSSLFYAGAPTKYFGIIWGLVGLGTIIHSLVDLSIALLVMRALVRQKSIAALFTGFPQKSPT